VGTGGVTADIEVVVTGATAEVVVVVVVWRDCAAPALGIATECSRVIEARAVGLLIEEPSTQLAPTTRTAATVVAFQCRRMRAGAAETGGPSSTMC
jgi:hypothetical protein